MRTLFKPERLSELIGRLHSLRPDSPREWGRMSPHGAVCHLADSFRAILGDRPLRARAIGPKMLLIRFVVFTLPIPWPKGAPTSPEVDFEKDGTPPGDFDVDVRDLEDLVRRFVATDGTSLSPHYVWGSMTRGEWGRYGYRHLDHHLRQFGC